QQCELKFKETPKKPIEYNYGPRSVAVGYFNNDSWLDMVVTNHIVHTIAIYRGQNGGTFSNPIQYPTGVGSTPYVAVVGDFNKDNLSYIAVANFGTNSIGIFLGYGNGSFEKYAEIPMGSSRPIMISVCDLNNDTQLDMVSANYGTHSISILYGFGNGEFTSPNRYTTDYDSLPSSVVSGEFNNDNYVDITVANYGTDNIVILFGNNNNTFANQVTISAGRGSRPHSITVGSFNSDTYLDSAVANYGRNEIAVILNLGNGTFEKPVGYSTGSASPYSINVGDFNQDNRLDIIVTNNGTNNTALFLGYGNGTFTEPTISSTGASSSISFAICDVNKDHRLDIIVISNDTGTLDILLGSFEGFQNQIQFLTGYAPSFIAVGNGSFSNPTILTVGSGPQSIAVGDFNNDTHLDIVVANSSSNDVTVLLGFGNGSFANESSSSTGAYPQSVAVGDFNKDTHLDIVIANSGSNTTSVLLGYGNGSFSVATTFSVGSSPQFVAVGDFNNDIKLDIVVANFLSNDVSVLLGYGNDSFANEIRFSTGVRPYSIAVDDLNNDTRMDIVVSNVFSNDVSVLLGYGDGSFANQIRFSTGSWPKSVAIGNFNSDNRLDIVVASNGNMSVSILLQYNRGFLKNELSCASGSGSKLRYTAVGGMNDDGQLDIILANYGTNNVGILFGLGNSSFLNQMIFNTGLNSHPSAIAIGDFNDDAQLDFAVTYDGARTADIFLGYGNGTFTRQINDGIYFEYSPIAVASGDLNNDGKTEIIVTYDASDNVNILVSSKNVVLSNKTKLSAGSQSQSIAIGDFNSDSRLDIVIVYHGSADISILLGYGNGSFSNQIRYSTGCFPQSVTVGDFNNDTRLDIAVVNFSSEDMSILLGYGNDYFANQTRFSAGTYPQSIGIGDFNKDTHLDIGIANYASKNMSVLLGYGNVYFANQTTFSIGSQPQSVAAGNFNNDTRLDLAVANTASDDVSVFFGGIIIGLINQSTLITGSGSLLRSVVIADFNNDSRMDVAVANSGSHSIDIFLGYSNYSFDNPVTYSTGSNPISIASGDFNNETQLDVVVSNYASQSISVFFGYDNGFFGNQAVYSTGSNSYPYFVAVGDFNSDIMLDIVVVSQETSSLTRTSEYKSPLMDPLASILYSSSSANTKKRKNRSLQPPLKPISTKQSRCQVGMLLRSSTPKTPLQSRKTTNIAAHPMTLSTSSLSTTNSPQSPRCSTPLFAKQRRTRPFIVCELCRQRAFQSSDYQRNKNQDNQIKKSNDNQQTSHHHSATLHYYQYQTNTSTIRRRRSSIDQLLVWII
ncbi:unnamed protein product, partial [Rotaria magnacalcarata]